MTSHILVNIGSVNGLSSVKHRAIARTIADLLISTLRNKLELNLNQNPDVFFQENAFQMLSAKYRPFYSCFSISIHCVGHIPMAFYITYAGITLCMGLTSERRRYIVTSSLIGWAHTHNDPFSHVIYMTLRKIVSYTVLQLNCMNTTHVYHIPMSINLILYFFSGFI